MTVPVDVDLRRTLPGSPGMRPSLVVAGFRVHGGQLVRVMAWRRSATTRIAVQAALARLPVELSTAGLKVGQLETVVDPG